VRGYAFTDMTSVPQDDAAAIAYEERSRRLSVAWRKVHDDAADDDAPLPPTARARRRGSGMVGQERAIAEWLEDEMNRSKLPNGVLSKLVELDEQVEYFTRKLANAENEDGGLTHQPDASIWKARNGARRESLNGALLLR
jgi:hypothetical protein